MELSVVMPCLNEAETVGTCVMKARSFLDRNGVSGEVVVADNGSNDGSQELATASGARVVMADAPGYGNALMAGIHAARSRYVIMGDADDSYDFTALQPFLDELRGGADLVMGNRFRGGIAPGAMPALHRYVGNPLLSTLGRMFFRSPVHDFHCGLRGFRREAVLGLSLQSTGMEFASEMVVKATLAGLNIVEVPTTLSTDGRSRSPHLRSWSDGWRHLRFLLLYSPRWLFLIPGVLLMVLGMTTGTALTLGPVRVGPVTFDVDTLVAAAAVLVIGFQAVIFAVLTKIYAIEEGFLPPDPRVERLTKAITLERGLAIGSLIGLLGISGLVASLVHWNLEDFGELDPRQSLRMVVPSAAALVISLQTIFAALFASVLGIRRVRAGNAEAHGDGGSAAAGVAIGEPGDDRGVHFRRPSEEHAK
ncbi:MAG: glycosyltransferase [Actinomycetota bacterium]|nr:glycosyltransferase [Actinomycetota bacterium]MDQ3679931.1 glycosyltransferase [Actinomycetota bacterium]